MFNENFPQPIDIDIDDILKTNKKDEDYKKTCQDLSYFLGCCLSDDIKDEKIAFY
ncbi:8433_t:CDS:1, partial [Cetraspora pellucida]